MYQIWVSLAKQCFSMVWFPNSWFYLSRKKCIVAIYSYFKKREKKLLREVYLLARCVMCHVRHAFIYATKTWNLRVFFYIFLSWKDNKIILKTVSITIIVSKSVSHISSWWVANSLKVDSNIEGLMTAMTRADDGHCSLLYTFKCLH